VIRGQQWEATPDALTPPRPCGKLSLYKCSAFLCFLHTVIMAKAVEEAPAYAAGGALGSSSLLFMPQGR
jgi:hypothetical protein